MKKNFFFIGPVLGCYPADMNYCGDTAQGDGTNRCWHNYWCGCLTGYRFIGSLFLPPDVAFKE